MAAQEPQAAVRLIFEYDGDQVRLVSEQRVEMIVPPEQPQSDADAGPLRATGFFVDTRDAADTTLWRARAPGAMVAIHEVFPENDSHEFLHVPVASPKGAFTVVVPDHPRASHVTLLRLPMAGVAGERVQPTSVGAAPLAPQPVDVASFPLRRR